MSEVSAITDNVNSFSEFTVIETKSETILGTEAFIFCKIRTQTHSVVAVWDLVPPSSLSGIEFVITQ